MEQWSYLGTGQTSGYTSPLGYTNAYVFDDAGQMTTVDYPAGTDTTIAYDASGRHTQMVDSTGTTTYTYNSAGELTTLAQPQGTTTYTYNAAGQRLTMNEAGSGTTTYSYDTAGRLASLVNPFSETTSFVYDTLGRVGQKTLANGTSEHYAYDTRSRLTQVQLKQGATVLHTTGYAWDNADQITSQTVNGVTTNYGYDLAGQLTSEVRSGYNVAYTYDANGNRLSKTVNGVAESYTYDLGDKILTAGAKSYTYDAAGRTIGINAPGGTTTLSYDYESRVTAISGPGINETHTYNGLDTRVGTVQGGVSRTFVRDGSYVTDPVLRDGQATYTPGVSERRGGVSTWSHSGLKNADAQTSGAGAIQATRVYDAFGAELSATGTWKGPFGYAGGFGYQEDSSGLKLLGHRYYDPTTGRFLSRDPIKDGRNWYVYAYSNPVRFSDPTGLGVYEWIYTGDWNSDSDNYDAALEAAATVLVGKEVEDPEKYRVRVGGPLNWVNPTGNAITPNGVTYINLENLEAYMENQWWRDHEHRHVQQREEIAREIIESGFHKNPDMAEWRKTVYFLSAITGEYAESGSHDGSGLEQDANNWAYSLRHWRAICD